MDLRRAMQIEFEHESDLTRSVLAIVPDELLGFKANDSMHSIRWNVSHLADIPSWAEMILNHPSFDVAPLDAPPHQTEEVETVADALQIHDRNIAEAKSKIDTFSLDSLEDEWSLLVGGQAVLTKPRYMIYRMYLINHIAHHRGHLLVYLRMNNIDTPRLYG